MPQSRGGGDDSFHMLIHSPLRWILENESGLLKTQLVTLITADVLNVLLVLDQISKALGT